MLRSTLLFSVLLVLGLGQLHATHLVGGNAGYEYLGQNPDGTYRYRATMITYTNCDSTSQVVDAEPALTGGIYINDENAPSADKQLQQSFIFLLLTSEIVSLTVGDSCTVGNTFCVKENLYEAFVDVPLNFGGYWIYYDRCCRNEIVNGQPQQGMGYTAYIPSPLVVNSSPVFSEAPAAFLCQNQEVTFLNTAEDPDGDQLTYSFVTPYRGFGDAMNPAPQAFPVLSWPIPDLQYEAGYNANVPFGTNGSALINGATGLTQYTAGDPGAFVIGVEIKEFRNGNLIATTRRDLQLVVLDDCPEQEPPALNEASVNEGETIFDVEEGTELCIPIIFTDAEGDSLTFEGSGEIFNPLLVDPLPTLSEPTPSDSVIQADFCWSTTCDQGRLNPYFFNVRATDDGCPPKFTNAVYTINVVPFTGATAINGDDTPCELSRETYVTDDFPEADYLWQVNGGAVVSGQGENEVEIEWGTLGAGSITVIVTNINGCVGDPLDLAVAIQPTPTVDAGADIEICLGDTVAIGGLPTGPAGSTFNWGPDSGLDNASSANPEAFPTETTNYAVTVVSASSCAAMDSIEIVVNDLEITTTDDVSICFGETTVIEASGATLYEWTPGADLDDPFSADPVAEPMSTTTYVVTAIDDDGCEDTDQVTVTVVDQPVTLAGGDFTVCGGTASLSAVSSVGMGEWSSVGGGVTFADLNDPSTDATVTAGGVYTLIWREEVQSLCSDQDTVLVTFIDEPLVSIVSETSACGLELALDATLAAGTGSWTTDAGELTFGDNAAGMTTLTSTDFGSYDITWTGTNFVCVETETITVTFSEQPMVDAGDDDELCGPTYTLDGSATVGDILWEANDDLDFEEENSGSTEVTTTQYGPQTITITADNEGCVTTDEVVITFVEQPVAVAGPDQAICGDEITLDATVSVGTGQWTTTSPNVTIADDTLAQTSVSSSTPQEVDFVWTETNGICSDASTVTIDFNQIPEALAGSDLDYCDGTITQLDGVGGGELLWSPADGLTDATIGDPFVEIEGDQQYVLTVTTVDGCVSTDTVEVVELSLPLVDVGQDIDYLCVADSIQFSGPAGFNGYLWTPNLDLSSNVVASPFLTPSANFTQEYILTVTDANGCVNRDSLIVTANLNVPTDAGSDTLICAGQPVMLGGIPTGPAGTTFVWDGGELNQEPGANPVVAPTTTTIYVVTSTNALCNGSDVIEIEVAGIPEFTFSADSVPECDGVMLSFENTGSPFFDYVWDFGDGSSSTEYEPSHLFAYGSDYLVQLALTTDDDCQFAIADSVSGSFARYFEPTFPNVMTPNGDGVNDFLDIDIRGAIDNCLDFEVFNRWGQTVFFSSGGNTKWDGRTISGEIVNEGVYFYYVRFKGFEHKGTVELKR